MEIERKVISEEILKHIVSHIWSGGFDAEANETYKRAFLVQAFSSQEPVALLMTFTDSDMDQLNQMHSFVTVTELEFEGTRKSAKPEGA